MNKAQREFKHKVFEKTVKRWLSNAGLDPQEFDMAEFDFDSYESVYDMFVDIAKNNSHPYSTACRHVLRMLEKNKDYYESDKYLYSEPVMENNGLEELQRALEDLAFRLEMRMDALEKNSQTAKGPETIPEVAALKAELESIRKQHTELLNKLGALEKAVAAATDKGSRRRGPEPKTEPEPEGPSPGGIARLLLALTVTTALTVIIMPFIADAYQWTFTETVLHGIYFWLVVIGLMFVEGLWIRTAFSNSRPRGEGFTAGYVYSQYMNPYKD